MRYNSLWSANANRRVLQDSYCWVFGPIERFVAHNLEDLGFLKDSQCLCESLQGSTALEDEALDLEESIKVLRKTHSNV